MARKKDKAAKSNNGTKTHRDARFSDNFMFARVMRENKDLCKELIERVLEIRIDHVIESDAQVTEMSILKKSVCFDVYLQSEAAAFCVEMQVASSTHLDKRMGFYRSRIYHRLLNKGEEYQTLLPTYVIFICTHDPYRKGLPLYTFEYRCLENLQIERSFIQRDVIVNTKGDMSLATPALAKLIQYIESGKPTSDDPFTVSLSDAVDDINQNEREWVDEMCDMETTYRILQEEAVEKATEKALAEGRAEGEARGEAKILARLEQFAASGANINEALVALKQH